MKSNTVPSNSPAMALPAGLSLEVIVALLDMDIPLPGNNHGLDLHVSFPGFYLL